MHQARKQAGRQMAACRGRLDVQSGPANTYLPSASVFLFTAPGMESKNAGQPAVESDSSHTDASHEKRQPSEEWVEDRRHPPTNSRRQTKQPKNSSESSTNRLANDECSPDKLQQNGNVPHPESNLVLASNNWPTRRTCHPAGGARTATTPGSGGGGKLNSSNKKKQTRTAR